MFVKFCTPLSVGSRFMWSRILRSVTLGLNGWSFEKINLPEKNSRNFFKPPNFSLSLAERFGEEVISASILPTSPTGCTFFSLRISVHSTSSAASDSTDSSTKLQYRM